MKQNWIKGDGLLVLAVLVGLASVVGLLRWIDAHRPPSDPSLQEENLYLNAATVKRMSLGFNGLAADWYWMRSLQYVGRKIVNLPENVQLDNLGQLNLRLLAPLLDATTTLDPQFMEPYQYAAVVLPETDLQAAIRITRKGIAANPSQWKLYHHLGYIYWQQKDFKTAGESYAEGAKLAGAPAWMEAMKARMASEGGSRNTAREIYLRIYEQAEDKHVKEMARKHLMGIASLDERDAIRRVMTAYKAKTGRCPSSWREIENVLRSLGLKLDSSGAPLDPAGTPYLFVKNKCDVKIDSASEVPDSE